LLFRLLFCLAELLARLSWMDTLLITLFRKAKRFEHEFLSIQTVIIRFPELETKVLDNGEGDN